MIRNFTTTGTEGCHCLDASAVLASLVDRSCTTFDGQEGILLTIDGVCVPHSYGSNSCRQHDMAVNPLCLVDGPDIPAYCIREWCYVDALTCMGASSERVYRSPHFAANSGVDMFYSYSTCASPAEDWLESQKNPMGEVSMKAITAAYNIMPWAYKRDYEGNIPKVPGREYYDNSMPAEGVNLNFVRSLQGIAEGDFTVDYVHGSRASRVVHPSSPGTAAVQDVADGLVDIAIGPIWITAERLKMTSFTMPIHHDKMVLVIPQPGSTSRLKAQTQKVLDPFQLEVWALLLAIIAVTALLSVWFSARGKRRGGQQLDHARTIRATVLARLVVDEFLSKGIFFCSAGVEQELGASLPQKLLMFGFAFFVLIVVSAYVANLAAFLTRNVHNHVGTIDEVIRSKLKICAHPALEDDLVRAHPDANFIFNKEGKEIFGLLEDYDLGRCDVMAVGKMDSLGDLKLMDMFCERNLVFTESLITENPVGFPIRPELASGFSYWIYQGEKYHGISVQSLLEAYDKREPNCDVILSEQNGESKFTRISAENLLFPLLFFLGFAILAVILQLYHQRLMRKNKEKAVQNRKTSFGRSSSLDLFASSRNVLDTRGQKEEKIKQEEEESHNVPQNNGGRSLGSIFYDEEEEIHDAEAGNNFVASIATGTAFSDSVHLDDSRDRTEKTKVSFSVDTDNDAHSNGMDNVTLSQLDPGVLVDEFIACYQIIQRRKGLTRTN